jgi:hypothetical protein
VAKYHQGLYKAIFPEKYMGDPTQIIYRSSWEKKFMIWCDKTTSIVKWVSEETIIPYICGTDNRPHRYFVDFRIQVQSKDGTLKTYLVEIKPLAQTQPPKYPGRQTRRYLTESMAFIKNQSKWKYAEQYCKDRGWEFKIITEKDLNV